MIDVTHNLAARYVQAIELEKIAWQELQAHAPGSEDRAKAWAAWSEAISSTNQAWRQLSCETLTNPRRGTGTAVKARSPQSQSATLPHLGH